MPLAKTLNRHVQEFGFAKRYADKVKLMLRLERKYEKAKGKIEQARIMKKYRKCEDEIKRMEVVMGYAESTQDVPQTDEGPYTQDDI